MEENKMTVLIKRLLLKFNLYWNFMCLQTKITTRIKRA